MKGIHRNPGRSTQIANKITNGSFVNRRHLLFGILWPFMAYSLAAQNTFPVTGNVGIGTTSPTAPLTIAAGSVYGNAQVYNALMLQPAGGLAYGANGSSLLLDSVTNHGIQPVAGIWSSLSNGGDGGINYNGSLVFGTVHQGSSAPTEGLRLDPFGNVGIGTPSPAAKLEVNGNVRLTPGSGSSMTYADGTVQSTAWNGMTLGGDYAESIDVLGDCAAYAPGDVIVIEPSSPGRFAKSGKAYSKLVAGVYSTKPGLVGRRLTFERLDKAAEVPMAMVGIVPTKVSTENGPIEPGDLLVSSSKPGYAMKGTDPIRLTGAILGKALAPLSSGDGVIEVMISIQ